MRFVSQPAISIAVTSRFSSRVAICVRRLRFPSQAFAISIASRCDFHRKPLRFQSRAFAISIASVCVFLRITDLPNYFPPPTAISSQACILCRLRFVRSARSWSSILQWCLNELHVLTCLIHIRNSACLASIQPVSAAAVLCLACLSWLQWCTRAAGLWCQ